GRLLPAARGEAQILLTPSPREAGRGVCAYSSRSEGSLEPPLSFLCDASFFFALAFALAFLSFSDLSDLSFLSVLADALSSAGGSVRSLSTSTPATSSFSL